MSDGPCCGVSCLVALWDRCFLKGLSQVIQDNSPAIVFIQ